MSLLGENIKRIRNQRGLTNVELSELAGVGKSTISQIETGARENLTSDILIKLAKALKVEVSTLTEPEGEYEVTDLLDTLSYVMLSDELSIDGKEMTKSEKDEFMLAVKVAVNMIKERRKMYE